AGLAVGAEIVAEAAAAGDEPRVFLAHDRLTDEAEAYFSGSRFLVEVGHRGRLLSAFLHHLHIEPHADTMGLSKSVRIPAFAGMMGVSTRLLSRQASRGATPALSPQRLGEAELVTIRVGQMEEALAPFGIARRRVRMIAGRHHARMQRVDVGMVEDDASPP